MSSAVALALVGLLTQPAAPSLSRGTFKTPQGTTLRYGISVPGGYNASSPRPLIVALHPGGGGPPFYGTQYLRTVFEPGLRELNAIMIAPDAPGETWTDAEADEAVMALVAHTREKFAIDPRRIAVAGFSMGGRGAWFMSSRHADLFTAAVIMAGQSEEPLAGLGRIPTYVIHSRDDERVPFGQAAQRVEALEHLGRNVRFDVLEGVGHFNMGEYADAIRRAARWVREQWGR